MEAPYVCFPPDGLLIPSRGTLTLFFKPEDVKPRIELAVIDEIGDGKMQETIQIRSPIVRLWHPEDQPDHLCVANDEGEITRIKRLSTKKQFDATHVLRACVRIRLSVNSPRMMLDYRLSFDTEDQFQDWLKAETDRPDSDTFSVTYRRSEISAAGSLEGSARAASV